MTLYLLDTNILIDLLGHKRSQSFFNKLLAGPPFRLGTSILCLAEFFSGANKREARLLKEWVENGELEVVYLDSLEQAIQAGSLRNKFSLALPDAFIVASALQVKGHFLTHDNLLLKKASQCLEVSDPLENHSKSQIKTKD